VYSRVPAIGGEYDLVSHGAHALLLVTWSNPIPPGVADRTVNVETIEYEIPIGVWVATHEGRTETKLGAGLTVRLDLAP
jgi:hypothetical protein